LILVGLPQADGTHRKFLRSLQLWCYIHRSSWCS